MVQILGMPPNDLIGRAEQRTRHQVVCVCGYLCICAFVRLCVYAFVHLRVCAFVHLCICMWGKGVSVDVGVGVSG